MTTTWHRLKELLHYNPETGVFTWLVSRGKVKAGSVAGRLNKDGHRRIKIDGVEYFAHRLAFLYMTGEWPKELIDHRDVDPANNRWGNLREATIMQNARNRRVASNNVLGIKGVRLYRGKYRASIAVNKEAIHLGTFDTLAEAIAMREFAAKDLHGAFARAA